MHEEILDKMQELLKDEVENFADDFSKAEMATMNLLLSLGKGL